MASPLRPFHDYMMEYNPPQTQVSGLRIPAKADYFLKIEVRKSDKFGRGVFARKAIPKETIIERAPLIVLDEQDTKMVRDSNVLVYYDFSYNEQYSAIAGGYGSFYNHSTTPNVDWEVDQEAEEIKYWTTRAIKKGEQLFINYGYDADEYFTVED